MMRRSGTGKKAASRQDVALVRMQLAAQQRNRQWHAFLCGKRDDLQARLGQQGYSSTPKQGSTASAYNSGSYTATPPPTQRSSFDEKDEASPRWDALSAQAAAPLVIDAIFPEAAAIEPTDGPDETTQWWDDKYHKEL